MLSTLIGFCNNLAWRSISYVIVLLGLALIPHILQRLLILVYYSLKQYICTKSSNMIFYWCFPGSSARCNCTIGLGLHTYILQRFLVLCVLLNQYICTAKLLAGPIDLFYVVILL